MSIDQPAMTPANVIKDVQSLRNALDAAIEAVNTQLKACKEAAQRAVAMKKSVADVGFDASSLESLATTIEEEAGTGSKERHAASQLRTAISDIRAALDLADKGLDETNEHRSSAAETFSMAAAELSRIRLDVEQRRAGVVRACNDLSATDAARSVTDFAEFRQGEGRLDLHYGTSDLGRRVHDLHRFGGDFVTPHQERNKAAAGLIVKASDARADAWYSAYHVSLSLADAVES